MTVTLKFALLGLCLGLHEALHTNKFTIFFRGLSLLGRVGSGHKSTDMLRVGSGRVRKILGRVGLGHKKVTHVQLWSKYY